MFYSINFLLKNLDRMQEVSNFALAFEKHRNTVGSERAAEAVRDLRGAGSPQKKETKIFAKKFGQFENSF